MAWPSDPRVIQPIPAVVSAPNGAPTVKVVFAENAVYKSEGGGSSTPPPQVTGQLFPRGQ